MFNLQLLQKISGGLKSKAAAMRAANEALNAKIAQFESDKTQSQSYIAENIKAARAGVVAKAEADLVAMREAAEIAGAQVKYWVASVPVELHLVRPGQSNRCIADCDAALAEAELLIAAMAGQSVDPVRKLVRYGCLRERQTIQRVRLYGV